uniref:Sulfite oxidase n=1 Tax=Angiostrongylus cantonensis TaxID=6313 RepID=A0A158P821_ANGCA
LQQIKLVVTCWGRLFCSFRYKKTQGLLWKGTAISNAEWTGVRLRDLLLLAGVDPNDQRIKHVHLEGADVDDTGQSYGASITFEKAMSPETIIAYSMNGADIPPDHGAPLRCVVPGVVGARQVKWLKTIRLSEFRAFSPGVDFGDKLDWKSVPAIQEYPIQSAFCIPTPGTKVERAERTIDVAGYAWSGGGRGIIRVEVSADGGKTWQSAELEQDPQQDLDHMWAWTFFRTSVTIPDGVDKVELVVKATDRAYNTQPETPAGIWNLRGLLNNAWHRVEVEIID